MTADSGYANALFDASTDLVEEARNGRVRDPLFRDELIERVQRNLRSGRSVLLVGESGVGTTAIVHGLAHRYAERNKELRQLTTAGIMAGTRYLGDWQTKLTSILNQAGERGIPLYLTDVANLPTAGRATNLPNNMLELVAPRLQARDVVLLGAVTPGQFRAMERVSGFTALFEIIEVDRLSDEEVNDVLDAEARRIGVHGSGDWRNRLIQLTSRFLPARPQPGPALNLLEQCAHYAEEKAAVGEPELLAPDFVDKVFSIYTGLPLFVISPRVVRPAREIRAWFQQRIVGQEEAIDAVVETIALYKAGLNDPGKPLGSFLFVGPTGVGKTELCRALAEFLFGSRDRLLRFDLSEFKDFHSFQLLVGSPGDSKQPARLLDPVRAQPFQVILFDELEKANPNIWDLLLPLLDEGMVTPPGGRHVDFRNTIIICTSNVGAGGAWKSVGFGGAPDETERSKSIQKALETAFRPEFLNRFAHTVIFHALSREQVRILAREEMKRIVEREGIAGRNLVLHVTDEALDLAIDRGVDPRYGARALKRELQRSLLLPTAMVLMEREVLPGAMLTVDVEEGRIRVRVADTEESLEQKKELKRDRQEQGRKRAARRNHQELLEASAQLVDDLSQLQRDVGRPRLLQECKRIEELRRDPAFWRDQEQAERDMRDLDRMTSTLRRIERLFERLERLNETLSGSKPDLARAADMVDGLRGALERTRRELVVLGDGQRWDAVVHIEPLPGGSPRIPRDFLVNLYAEWAAGGKRSVTWLLDPMDDGEPAMFVIDGPWAAGYLMGEAGLHRVRSGEEHGAARVRIFPWTDRRDRPEFQVHRALKAQGAYGGKVRSRLVCNEGLILQNERTLNDNRQTAAELFGSWLAAPAPSDLLIRRVELSPFKMKDAATGKSSTRPESLGPRFHDLLCTRIDRASAPDGD